MSNRTRREFLITTGSGVAAGVLASKAGYAQYKPAPGAPPLRIRKNVVSAAAKSDLDSLNRGVARMRALVNSAPTDPRGWILQAFIHGNCNGFTKCQHGNWFFPPWHRSFLYYFEALIQHYSGDNNFALPYWDWSRTHGVPGSFYGAANPLDDILSIRTQCPSAPTAGRGVTVKDQFSQSDLDTYVGSTVINRIQQNPDYATYGGRANSGGELERTPHNFVHRWVGGTKGSNMVRAYSPLDPIFWMHHCNVDRLYSNWLSRPGHNPPPETTWKQKSFNDFFDKDGNPAGSQFTCEATVDSRVMNYIYDETMEVPGPLTERLTARRTAATSEEVVATVTAARLTKGVGVLTFATEGAPTPEARRVMNATALGADDYVVRLGIEGIKRPARQNTGVHVFLGPGITAQTPITAPGYVGSFTFFDGGDEGGTHAHEGARNLLLNASNALKRLYGDISVPEAGSLSVSLVTRPLYTGVSAFATVEEIQPERVQLEVVRLA